MQICSLVRRIQTTSQRRQSVNSYWVVNGKSQHAAGASNRPRDFDGNPRVDSPANVTLGHGSLAPYPRPLRRRKRLIQASLGLEFGGRHGVCAIHAVRRPSGADGVSRHGLGKRGWPAAVALGGLGPSHGPSVPSVGAIPVFKPNVAQGTVIRRLPCPQRARIPVFKLDQTLNAGRSFWARKARVTRLQNTNPPPSGATAPNPPSAAQARQLTVRRPLPSGNRPGLRPPWCPHASQSPRSSHISCGARRLAPSWRPP
jgi:hypothetical protein